MPKSGQLVHAHRDAHDRLGENDRYATGLGVTATDQANAIRVPTRSAAHCMTLMEYIGSPRVDVLSVCSCGGSRTRTAACQELAKTGANRGDRATQAGHADFADLELRNAVAHLSTLSCSLGIK